MKLLYLIAVSLGVLLLSCRFTRIREVDDTTFKQWRSDKTGSLGIRDSILKFDSLILSEISSISRNEVIGKLGIPQAYGYQFDENKFRKDKYYDLIYPIELCNGDSFEQQNVLFIKFIKKKSVMCFVRNRGCWEPFEG